MRVLLVEDDSATAQAMELMLKSEGFRVYTTDLGEEACDLAKHYAYEIILLDLGLPDMSGLDVLRTIRAAKVASPVMVVSGASGIDERVRALSAGADDFLQKPFHKDELVARIHAIVRRAKGHAESKLEFGPISINLDSRTVDVGETRVRLTGKEYQITEALALARGATVTKDGCLNHLYGGADEPEIKIVDVFICKVRNKLRDAGADGHIETVWGRGYRMVAAPVFKPRNRTYLRRDRKIMDLVMERLADGQATAKELAAHVPDASEGGLRKAVAVAVEHGVIENFGSAGNAMYRLTASGRARFGGKAAAA